jgi:hypothetical protein
MNTSLHHTFENTLTGLTQGLRVKHIATFQVDSCSPDENAGAVLTRHPDYDQIPVREDGRTVGVLERVSDSPSGKVSAAMRPLDDSILVAGEAPILDFLSLIRDRP